MRGSRRAATRDADGMPTGIAPHDDPQAEASPANDLMEDDGSDASAERVAGRVAAVQSTHLVLLVRVEDPAPEFSVQDALVRIAAPIAVALLEGVRCRERGRHWWRLRTGKKESATTR